jgi:hypothetical protein
VGRGDERDHALGFLQGVAGVACHFSPPRLGLLGRLGVAWGRERSPRPRLPFAGTRRRQGATLVPHEKKLDFFVFFEKIKLIFFECQQTSATEMPDTGDF